MATINQLNTLADDQNFRARIRTLVLQQAAVVYIEGTGVTGHAVRAALAAKVIGNTGFADALANVLVTRTNLSGSAVTFDYTLGHHVTDASDAAILSQIASDWSMLAGV